MGPAKCTRSPGATGPHDVGVKVLAGVQVAPLAGDAGLASHFGAAETLAANNDDVPVGQLVRPLLVGALVAAFISASRSSAMQDSSSLISPHSITFGRRGEGVPALCEELQHVLVS